MNVNHIELGNVVVVFGGNLEMTWSNRTTNKGGQYEAGLYKTSVRHLRCKESQINWFVYVECVIECMLSMFYGHFGVFPIWLESNRIFDFDVGISMNWTIQQKIQCRNLFNFKIILNVRHLQIRPRSTGPTRDFCYFLANVREYIMRL